MVEETPDATLKQELGGSGSKMIIYRAFQKLGLLFKQKSRHASERDTPEVRKKRREFREEIEPIEPGRLVFVDETGVTMAMAPSYGRAPRGGRVEASTPASSESVIAAMGWDGVQAPLAFPGSVNAATFESYVDEVLVPALHRGDVVVFDTLSSHLSAAVFEAINRAGARVLPLPPYSPDLTPIEEIFSRLKEFLRRIGARANDRLYDAIGEGLRQVTPQGILCWFRRAEMGAAQA